MATLSTLNILDLGSILGKGKLVSVELTNVEITRTSIKGVPNPSGGKEFVMPYEISASTGTATLRNRFSEEAPITSAISTVSLTIYVPVIEIIDNNVNQVPDLTTQANVTTRALYAKGTVIGTWSAEDLATIGIE